MIQFFSFYKDITLVGDVKWKFSKYILVKNLSKPPSTPQHAEFTNYDISKKSKWSVLLKHHIYYDEYKATSLLNALVFIYKNTIVKTKKKSNTNIFKRK
jgi:hypothetical protein